MLAANPASSHTPVFPVCSTAFRRVAPLKNDRENQMNQLPNGSFISAFALPADCTEQTLYDLFQKVGLNIPYENISVTDADNGARAMVSIDKETACDIVNWILNGAALDGRPVRFRPPFVGR
jgi:hypothetical protein